MLLKSFVLISLCVTCSLAGICQDVFKDPTEDRPFFKVLESQGVEIYYPKRDPKQDMFGIKIYKNQDLRKKDLHCDLCVNTTHVENGCFKIKSTLLSVEPRDVLKYTTLASFTGKSEISVSPANKAEFTDYVIPAPCVCSDPPAGYCDKASSKITDYRPLFKFHESSGFGAYLPRASSTAAVGLQALKNANFRPGTASQQQQTQKLDLNVDSMSERNGCFAYESSALRFALGDHINFVVTGKKTGGEKIRTDPRKVHLRDYFIPATCSCPAEQSNLVKPHKLTRH
ncbi:AAEL006962-PB [Aedes aegypti]|uniref:AAEL006962-PB n=2 Tax=Aedes aegypti TaxID=7159 RepID=A0A1S4FF32_AEDAE|nr:uncharacterized protein LOC5568624 [Aedes aegypti]EAT41389.1 AAEL006962-PB [Aedes aegypti]